MNTKVPDRVHVPVVVRVPSPGPRDVPDPVPLDAPDPVPLDGPGPVHPVATSPGPSLLVPSPGLPDPGQSPGPGHVTAPENLNAACQNMPLVLWTGRMTILNAREAFERTRTGTVSVRCLGRGLAPDHLLATVRHPKKIVNPALVRLIKGLVLDHIRMIEEVVHVRSQGRDLRSNEFNKEGSCCQPYL